MKIEFAKFALHNDPLIPLNSMKEFTEVSLINYETVKLLIISILSDNSWPLSPLSFTNSHIKWATHTRIFTSHPQSTMTSIYIVAAIVHSFAPQLKNSLRIVLPFDRASFSARSSKSYHGVEQQRLSRSQIIKLEIISMNSIHVMIIRNIYIYCIYMREWRRWASTAMMWMSVSLVAITASAAATLQKTLLLTFPSPPLLSAELRAYKIWLRKILIEQFCATTRRQNRCMNFSDHPLMVHSY